MADRIGWADRRLSALRDQADAVRWQWSQEQQKFAREQDVFGCDWLRRPRRHPTLEAQLGESALLRRQLADASITVSQAAERSRAEVREREQKRSGKPDAVN